MKDKQIDDIGLEVANESSESIVYRKIIRPSSRKIKNRKTVTKNDAEIVLHYFDPQDFNTLKDIEDEIGEKYLKKRNTLIRIVGGIYNTIAR